MPKVFLKILHFTICFWNSFLIFFEKDRDWINWIRKVFKKMSQWNEKSMKISSWPKMILRNRKKKNSREIKVFEEKWRENKNSNYLNVFRGNRQMFRVVFRRLLFPCKFQSFSDSWVNEARRRTKTRNRRFCATIFTSHDVVSIIFHEVKVSTTNFLPNWTLLPRRSLRDYYCWQRRE